MGRVYNEIITSQVASGTAFNTFTTAASVLNAQAKITIPANSLVVGDIFRIKAQFGMSNVITAQDTFSFQVMMGSVIAFTSGAIATNAAAHTLIPAELNVTLKVNAIGSGTTAKFMGIGTLAGIMWAATGAGVDLAPGAHLMVPATAPALGTGFNSTADQILDLFVACGASNAGNGGVLYNYIVEKLSYQSSSLIQ